jgi:septum formation protein
MKLVLASTSPYRRQLLDRLGLDYDAAAHRCDERSLTPQGSLEEHALTLARAKASSLRTRYPDALILGSDQLAEVDEEMLGKPGSREAAHDQLRRLRGRSHRLLTAVALERPGGRVDTAVDVHTMHMRQLDDDAIGRYLDLDTPFDCAGSYKIEAAGIALFERIEGDDFTAIIGLPLLSVVRLLSDAGVPVP